jgi:hypothetical protein
LSSTGFSLGAFPFVQKPKRKPQTEVRAAPRFSESTLAYASSRELFACVCAVLR